MNKTIVVGAGPAGLMAAIQASSSAKVAVFEHKQSVGLKLLATGGGRCNLTNTLPPEELAGKFGKNWRFTLPAIQTFTPDDLRKFFANLAVPSSSPDGFHVFPISNRAGDILNALLSECGRKKVEIRTGTAISSLIVEKGKIAGAVTDKGENISVEKIILACGGKSYSTLGSDGSGYLLAKSAGHSIINPVPALVELKTGDKWPTECAGITRSGVRLQSGSGRNLETSHGEIIFTHSGVSGPAVLNISGKVSEQLATTPNVYLFMNFFPERDKNSWMSEFEAWHRDEGKKLVANLLGKYLPKNLATSLCKEAGCHEIEASRFASRNRETLADLLVGCPLRITGTSGFGKAMVTRGGVPLKEVDPKTLESRIVPGLYFAGEILDIDGPCGGFNLQWAFSSGHLAGTS